MNKLYRGVRRNNVATAYVDNEELSFAEAKRLHPSDATAEWGYFGDGPSQTALAILRDAISDYPSADEIALTYYHDFKFEFIATAEFQTGFLILQSQIKEWLAKRLDNGPMNDKKGWIV